MFRCNKNKKIIEEQQKQIVALESKYKSLSIIKGDYTNLQEFLDDPT